MIRELLATEPAELRKAEVSTGNRFLGRILKRENTPPEEVTIWPMHYFLPWHKSDPETYYSGPDKVYAEQQYGTSLWAYNKRKGETVDAATLAARRQEMIDRLIGGQGRPLSPLRGRDDDRRAAAHDAARAAAAAETARTFRNAVTGLNAALAGAMQQAGEEPRFHGLHYYRRMQQQSLEESSFKTRSAGLRYRLLGWLASARRALLLGYDTGHLALAARHLAPDLDLTAIEGGRWFVEKDNDPPLKRIYAPAAAAFLAADENGINARFENEASFLDELAQDPPAPGFDLVLFTNADIRLLALAAKLRALLSEDAVVVLASEAKGGAASHADRLRLQRMAYAPFDQFELPSGLGGYTALRLIPPEPSV